MPQTTYNLRSVPAVPGMLFDANDLGNDIMSFPAKFTVPFGVAVELNSDGTVQPAQTATTGAPPAKLIGISVFDLAREQQYPPSALTPTTTPGYAAGEMVPVMTRGRIYVAQDGGGTWTNFGSGTLNVWHSSTGANPQGVFTFTAAQTTAGAEIDNVPAWCVPFKPASASPNAFVGTFTDGFGQSVTVGVVSVNFPGHV